MVLILFLIKADVAAVAPFANFYPAFDFMTVARAPDPDFAVFWFAIVAMVIKVVFGVPMEMFVFFPAGAGARGGGTHDGHA